MTCCVQAQDVSLENRPSAGVTHFELPAQPVVQVLQFFSSKTSLAVIAPSPLLQGRISTPINGDYTPREALERVLAGTGLAANFTGVDEAIIVPQPASPPEASVDSSAIAISAIDGVLADGDHRAYAAMIQTRLIDALCESPQTRPGDYRLVAQLRIGDTGAVVASDMVSSTGLPARDAAIERTIQALVLDSPPPAGLPQPVTILLRPAADGVHASCPQPDGRG